MTSLPFPICILNKGICCHNEKSLNKLFLLQHLPYLAHHREQTWRSLLHCQKTNLLQPLYQPIPTTIALWFTTYASSSWATLGHPASASRNSTWTTWRLSSKLSNAISSSNSLLSTIFLSMAWMWKLFSLSFPIASTSSTNAFRNSTNNTKCFTPSRPPSWKSGGYSCYYASLLRSKIRLPMLWMLWSVFTL